MLITEGTLVKYCPWVYALLMKEPCLHLSHLFCFFTACFSIKKETFKLIFTETSEVRSSGLCCATLHCKTARRCMEYSLLTQQVFLATLTSEQQYVKQAILCAWNHSKVLYIHCSSRRSSRLTWMQFTFWLFKVHIEERTLKFSGEGLSLRGDKTIIQGCLVAFISIYLCRCKNKVLSFIIC